MYRPSSLYGSVHNAGSKIILSIILIYLTKNSMVNSFFTRIKFISIIIASFSQRSIILGYLIFRLSKHPFVLITILIISAIYIFDFIDPSNGLKIFMWMHIFSNINYDSYTFLFGYGLNSSSNLLAFVDFSGLAQDFGISNWDIIPTTEKLPHNIYVQMIYEVGLIFFVLYTCFLLKVFIHLKKYDSVLFLSFFIFIINFSDT